MKSTFHEARCLERDLSGNNMYCAIQVSPGMSTTVTQKDVAEHLGISPGMVGRALRNDPAYTQETRQRIQLAAQELGYRLGSNHDARQLASRRHGLKTRHSTIGWLWRDTGATHPFWLLLQNGIQTAALDNDVEVLLLHHLPSLGWDRVDGIIGITEDPAFVVHGSLSHLPFVSIIAESDCYPHIIADETDGMKQAVNHLIALGHRKIAYFADPCTHMVQKRVAAFNETLDSAGIPVQKSWQWLLWDWGPMEKRGLRSAEAWIRRGFAQQGFTAIVVQNDRAAIGTINALHAAGLRVPQDISVIGFDSTDECELASPRLTSVKLPLVEIGKKAVEVLLEMNQHEAKGQDVFRLSDIVMPVTLDVRDSTAPVLRRKGMH
jgi:DNA-binding LacI/PurR family transcriptional regulator